MSGLSGQHCEACQKSTPRVNDEEKLSLHREVPDWQLLETADGERLQRVFRLADFARALAFTNRVGALAEAENHHPVLVLEYGKVTVSWWTHAIGGLHKNDFVMAARTDAAYRDLSNPEASKAPG